MQNINLFIKENVKKIGNDAHISPNIPEKKLNNAIKSFKCEDFYESIVAIYDSTVFGSSKEGFVFTGEKMLFNDGDLIEFRYKDIVSAEYIKNITTNEKGKEKVDEYTVIETNDGKKRKIEGIITGNFNYKEFAAFITLVSTDFDEYKEEDQLKTISDMPDELKIAYLKIIINMAYVDDGTIDEKELAEIFLLMTRLELSSKSRFKVRESITNASNDIIDSVESSLEIIKKHSLDSHYSALMISLVKDLINIHFSAKDSPTKEFAFLENNKQLFGTSESEIDLAYETVKNDYKLLKENLDDSAIEKNAKELASKAAAAGAPLAAVYISGSVIGMSAAGITSGLATLGMGMGMTGGLAMIGIIGMMSYKGMKHLTGANELDKYKTRELMLQDVVKQTQKTISLIIDDINHIVSKLNEAISTGSANSEKVKKLSNMMAQFQGALKQVDSKTDAYTNSINRIKCPEVLDFTRFESLTTDTTKKPLFDFVMMNYTKDIEEMAGIDVAKYTLNNNVETEALDKMSEIFKALGYFNMDSILKGKATGMLKGVFG